MGIPQHLAATPQVPEIMPETNEEDFIATARRRFQAAADDEKLLRDEALIDLKFVAGDQWDPGIRAKRELADRPVMTFPRCHTFVQQVSNEARQNKPQIKFVEGDGGDKDTADVLEGMARHIQYSSDAQVAYETAVEYSAGGSFGYYRFLTDYCEEGSDDLELKILPVFDPFAIYGILIPACFRRKPKFAFVIEDVPKDEFKLLYPKSEIVTLGWEAAEKKAEGWVGTETVRVAEYWYVEEPKQKRGRPTVKFCKITGLEKLENTETTWPGKSIPIIPVLGKQMILEGKPKLFSVVRHQRDAQKMINYSKTRIAETLSTAPISPFIGAAGQFATAKAKWDTANTKIWPFIEYDVKDIDGKPAPPPQRQTFEPPIQSLSEFTAQEIDDMKATTGIFDASLGQKSNEQSGQAILRRQQQSNMTTMHFMDNLERAFKEGGDVMADVMRIVYDGERMVDILGEDESAKVVKVNAPYDDNGKQKHHKLTEGKYRAIVTMGRAFSTKRMESFDMMTQLIANNKEAFPMVADIMFRNSDLAGADQLAERFKKMLPPQLQDSDDGDPEAQVQALKGKLAQATQQVQALNAFAAELEKEKEGKVVEWQGKARIAEMQEMSKTEIVKMQEATKLAVAQINATKDANQQIADRELETFKILHGPAHDAATAAQQRQHELTTQGADQAHEAGMVDKQAEIAAQQADQGHAQTLEQQQQAAELAPKPEEQNA